MRFFRTQRNWGMLLLGVWLIAHGILTLAPNLAFSQSGTLLAILAIVAGGLLLLGR